MTLDKNSNRALKIAGGVAAAVAIGALLISGSGDDESNSDTYNITLVPPQ